MKGVLKLKLNKYFLMSMFFSGLLVVFIIGLEYAEYNMRDIIFDDGIPFFEYDLSSNKKFINFIFMGNVIKIRF